MTTTPPPVQVFFIASQAPPYTSTQPFVLDVQGSDPSSGSSIITWPEKTTDAQNQLWSMTSDGYIISQLNGYALTLSEEATIFAQPVDDPSYPDQLWSVTNDGYIVNQQYPNL